MKKYILPLLLILASCASTPAPDTSPCPPIKGGGVASDQTCVAMLAPERPLGVLFAWADRSNVWRTDDDGIVRLKIQFLDGSELQRNNAMARFNKVADLAPGLEIKLADPGEEGDIRVAFKSLGHWSYLGRQAARIDGQTMNIQLSGRDRASEWDRVAIHEFLHALGFEHEHQHPRALIPWDRNAVYRDYARTQGWSRQQVDYQVLNRKQAKTLEATPFDPGSIMLYPIPAAHTRGRLVVGWNTALSPCDIELLKRLYPAPQP